jgi:P-type Ca2+ transporter type 2C
LLVIVINTIIGFWQEFQAEKNIQSLGALIENKAKVLRDNNLEQILTKNLVIGDVVLLEEGDKIPADCRIIKLKDLKTLEASLTGESLPISKSLEPLSKISAIGDQNNILFAGTIISAGSCSAVVISVGDDTEFGKIAKSISNIDESPSHFQIKTDILAKQLALISLFFTSIFFVLNYFIQGRDLFETFFLSTALLVSSVPAGLPAILTVVLAFGAKKMAEKKAVIRNLTAIETLGVINTICTDKTGTLTQNTMTVREIYLPNKQNTIEVTGEGWSNVGNFVNKNQNIVVAENMELVKFLEVTSLCNLAKVVYHEDEKQNYQIIGDPTEASLTVLAEKAQFYKNELLEIYEIIEDLPFKSENKFRASLVRNKETQEVQIMVVGSPEIILNKSKYLFDRQDLNTNQTQEIQNKFNHTTKKVIELWQLPLKNFPNL